MEGFLGLTAMKSHGVIINTLQNTNSWYGGTCFCSNLLNPISPSEGTQETIGELHHTTSVVCSEDRIDITDAWKNIISTVSGEYEITDHVASPVRIRGPDTPIGKHICLGGSTNIKRSAIEPTTSSVQIGHVNIALVVNTTGSPIEIKPGLTFGECLLYDRNVATNPLEISTAWVAKIGKSMFTTAKEQGTFLSSAVKVGDYPELKPSLTEVEIILQHFDFSRGAFKCYL